MPRKTLQSAGVEWWLNNNYEEFGGFKRFKYLAGELDWPDAEIGKAYGGVVRQTIGLWRKMAGFPHKEGQNGG